MKCTTRVLLLLTTFLIASLFQPVTSSAASGFSGGSRASGGAPSSPPSSFWSLGTTVRRHAAEQFEQIKRLVLSCSSSSSNDESSNPRKKKKSDDNAVIVVLSPRWARFWYTATAINPTIAVIFNDYARMVEPVKSMQTQQQYRLVRSTYETIFFFAKLKPRVSFAIGAIFRALQLTTALQYAFDPGAGVGFGLNIICLFAKSRWPAVTVLGWSATKIPWKMLGALPPKGQAVPITISMRKDKGDAVIQGYRLGL